MSHIYAFLNRANSLVQGMDMKEWAVVGVLVVLVSTFTMKGFGSRKNY